MQGFWIGTEGDGCEDKEEVDGVCGIPQEEDCSTYRYMLIQTRI